MEKSTELLYERLAKVEAELERYRAQADVLSGKACKEEQDDGNGPCGVCVRCLNDELDRYLVDVLYLRSQLDYVDMDSQVKKEQRDRFKSLLVRYAVHVMEHEGTHFLDDLLYEVPGGLSKEEVREILALYEDHRRESRDE